MNRLALCLLLAGCTTPATDGKTIDRVQAAAVFYCGIAPTAAEIVALYTTNTTVTTTEKASEIFCKAYLAKLAAGV